MSAGIEFHKRGARQQKALALVDLRRFFGTTKILHFLISTNETELVVLGDRMAHIHEGPYKILQQL